MFELLPEAINSLDCAQCDGCIHTRITGDGSGHVRRPILIVGWTIRGTGDHHGPYRASFLLPISGCNGTS